MINDDWNYSRIELDEAQNTNDESRLRLLSTHPSKFVRAQVAGNRHSPRALRESLSLDSAKGVIVWLISNPSLTKEEFDGIYLTAQKESSGSIITQALASSQLADMMQLHQLTRDHNWCIKLEILNNHVGRGDDYKQLIEQYLAKEGTRSKNWDEIEKLAYFRIFNIRYPPDDDSE